MNSKNCIIVRIYGRSGSQLLKYSFGRSLSAKYSKKSILDIFYFKNPLIDF
jgi:hypothetical protein